MEFGLKKFLIFVLFFFKFCCSIHFNRSFDLVILAQDLNFSLPTIDISNQMYLVFTKFRATFYLKSNRSTSWKEKINQQPFHIPCLFSPKKFKMKIKFENKNKHVPFKVEPDFVVFDEFVNEEITVIFSTNSVSCIFGWELLQIADLECDYLAETLTVVFESKVSCFPNETQNRKIITQRNQRVVQSQNYVLVKKKGYLIDPKAYSIEEHIKIGCHFLMKRSQNKKGQTQYQVEKSHAFKFRNREISQIQHRKNSSDSTKRKTQNIGSYENPILRDNDNESKFNEFSVSKNVIHSTYDNLLNNLQKTLNINAGEKDETRRSAMSALKNENRNSKNIDLHSNFPDLINHSKIMKENSELLLSESVDKNLDDDSHWPQIKNENLISENIAKKQPKQFLEKMTSKRINSEITTTENTEKNDEKRLIEPGKNNFLNQQFNEGEMDFSQSKI